MLILASASPRRQQLLARLGGDWDLRPTTIDETPRHGEAPADLVRRLAVAKAKAVDLDDPGVDPSNLGQHTPSDHPPPVILAADTIVELDGQILGKPRDADEAVRMLRALSGRTHRVLTGVAVRRDDLEVSEVVTTGVTFRPLTDSEIVWYLKTGEPGDKAGAYGLQGAGAVFIERIDGSETNVIGLPLAQTVALLRRVGVDLLRRDRSGTV